MTSSPPAPPAAPAAPAPTFPPPVAERFLAAARSDLSDPTRAIARVASGGELCDPAAWAQIAGLSVLAWDTLIDAFGEVFVSWFRAGLSATPLERACLDRVWWSALIRETGGGPNAATLRIWAEAAGHLREPPAPPSVPLFTLEQAQARLAGLGVAVLAEALAAATAIEAARTAPVTP